MSDLFIQKQDEHTEDEDWHFQLTGTFEDLVSKGWSFADLYAYIDDGEGQIAWTGDDCCVLPTDMDPPEHQEYSITVLVTLNDNNKTQRKFQVTAPDAEDATSTIMGLFLLCNATTGSTIAELAFKLFATNPRKVFPTLPKDELMAATSKGNIESISFQFCGLDSATADALTHCPFQRLELRQSTVYGGWNSSLSGDQGPSSLKLSCTLVEFDKVISSIGTNTTVENVELLLHFMLQGEFFERFCKALSANKALSSMKLAYLELNDDGWEMLLESLHEHPVLQTLDLSFTDNFVDNFRRLTPERRTKRTEAVLKLAEANPRIQQITWPECQQDEELMSVVKSKLDGNRKAVAA